MNHASGTNLTRFGCRGLAVVAVLWLPAASDAQVWVGGSTPRRGSVEISGGALVTAGQSLPSQAATLTVNPSTGLSSFDLFTSNPSLGPALGAQGTVTVYITRAFAVEGGMQFSRPRLDVELSADAEDAPDITASTTITEYVFSGSLVYHFGTAARTMPFVAAGAGHLRDVHTGNELVETGTEYHGKAGLKMWFADPRRPHRLGLRMEAGLSVRNGGFNFDDDERRMAPTGAVSLLYLF
jgi:hypothetical protein